MLNHGPGETENSPGRLEKDTCRVNSDVSVYRACVNKFYTSLNILQLQDVMVV